MGVHGVWHGMDGWCLFLYDMGGMYRVYGGMGVHGRAYRCTVCTQKYDYVVWVHGVCRVMSCVHGGAMYRVYGGMLLHEKLRVYLYMHIEACRCI